jgi:hypothetical protein
MPSQFRSHLFFQFGFIGFICSLFCHQDSGLPLFLIAALTNTAPTVSCSLVERFTPCQSEPYARSLNVNRSTLNVRV